MNLNGRPKCLGHQGNIPLGGACHLDATEFGQCPGYFGRRSQEKSIFQGPLTNALETVINLFDYSASTKKQD